MMQYQFSQAVQIVVRKVTKGGHVDTPYRFGKGVHFVPPEVEEHAHFLDFVKAGYIAENVENKPQQESFQERAQRLAKRLEEQRAPKAPVPKESEPPKKRGKKAEAEGEEEKSEEA